MSKNSYAYEPMLYEDGWKQLSKDEINKRIQKPVVNINTNKSFNFKVINSNGEEVGRVNTPNEYYQQMRAGNKLDIYTTYDSIDEGLFRGVAIPLLYLSRAKPSKYSYVRSFPFDNQDPLSVLPANFVNYAGSDQHKVHDKAVSENRSWRYLAPGSRIIEMNPNKLKVYSTFGDDIYDIPKEERYQGNMPSHSISPAVLGDLNGDGYEDIVLSCAFYYVGGSGRYYYFSVLTRKSSNSILKDITDQVNKLVWGE
jgi:hypothetical protein